MKVYFIMLAVLWLSRTIISLWALGAGQHPAFMLNHLADVVLFSVCLAGTFEAAFGKKIFKRMTTDSWRLASRATMLTGALSTMLYLLGQKAGIPSPIQEPGLLTGGMILLPYVLFAAPVIVHEHRLREAEA